MKKNSNRTGLIGRIERDDHRTSSVAGFVLLTFLVLGTDPWPIAPDVLHITGIPFGTCGLMSKFCFEDYFDMDGLDVVNVDLTTVGIDPDLALAQGELILKDFNFPDPASRRCIHRPKHLAISFDDDDKKNWTTGNSGAPVGSASPGGATFGTTAALDEVVTVILRRISAVSSPPTHRKIVSSGMASEAGLHVGLELNPDSSESEDDDVDALDVQRANSTCDVVVFGADNEANDGLEFDAIYQFEPSTGVLTPLIRADVHLGLASGTDINAFEFAWINTEAADGNVYPALALLFSVDDGGSLNPGTINGSFLDGTYFEVVTLSDTEDLDGIGIARSSLVGWRGGNPDAN